MYLSERWSGMRLRRSLAAVLGAIYVLAIAVILFFTLPAWIELPLVGVATLSASILVAWMVQILLNTDDLKRSFWAILPTLLMLVTIVPVLFGASRLVFIIGVCIAWILVVRSIAQGNPLLFAFLAVLGVGVVAGVTMGLIESRDTGDGGINSLGDAFIWAGSRMFGFSELSALQPTTFQGKLMGFFILLCGIFFAAVMVSAVTTWVMGERSREQEEALEARVQLAVDQGIRTAIIAALGHERAADILAARPPGSFGKSLPGAQSGRYAGSQMWIDNDQVVGRTPEGWWNERDVATVHFLRWLADSVEHVADLPEWPGREEETSIMVVLEGDARKVSQRALDTDGGVPFVLCKAARSGAAYILERASSNDVVITSNRSLRDQLVKEDVTVVSVERFRHVVAHSRRPTSPAMDSAPPDPPPAPATP